MQDDGKLWNKDRRYERNGMLCWQSRGSRGESWWLDELFLFPTTPTISTPTPCTQPLKPDSHRGPIALYTIHDLISGLSISHYLAAAVETLY